MRAYISLTNNSNEYYVTIEAKRKLILDKEVADYLKIEFNEYLKLLKEYKAFSTDILCGYYFKDDQQGKKFIAEVVEPRLVMKQLAECS